MNTSLKRIIPQPDRSDNPSLLLLCLLQSLPRLEARPKRPFLLRTAIWR